MKNFTVKDFILYNSPCFNCGGNINFYFEFEPASDYGNFSKRAMVTTDFVEVELVVHYANNLLIKIENKTNKYTTNNHAALTTYLSKFELSLHSRCERCFTDIVSNTLKFDEERNVICPTTIKYEQYQITDNENVYAVYTKLVSNDTYSKILVSKINATKNISTYLNMPPLPIYKFKTKEKFLNKIKTYVTFS